MKESDLINILIIGLVCYIVYLFWSYCSSSKKTPEKFTNKSYNIVRRDNKPIGKKKVRFQLEEQEEPLNSLPDTHEDVKPNQYFTNTQFHTDYRDTITAFGDIAPMQKDLFNESNLAVSISNPHESEVIDLVKEFIAQLNNDVVKNVGNYLDTNSGWDEPLPQKKVKSGWEKQREELGLPPSLYGDPAEKAPVKLLAIDTIEKQKTDYETKYEITLILRKVNVQDQMVVKVSFIKDNGSKSPIKSNDPNYPSVPNVVVESIWVLGFLTDEGLETNPVTADNLYSFDNLEQADIIDNKSIIKQLNRKYNQINNSDRLFQYSLDPEGQETHTGIPPLTDFDSYKCMRSIYDDLSGKPIRYS